MCYKISRYNCLISFRDELSESQLTQFALVIDYDCKSSNQQRSTSKHEFIGLQAVPLTSQEHVLPTTALPGKFSGCLTVPLHRRFVQREAQTMVSVRFKYVDLLRRFQTERLRLLHYYRRLVSVVTFILNLF